MPKIYDLIIYFILIDSQIWQIYYLSVDQKILMIKLKKLNLAVFENLSSKIFTLSSLSRSDTSSLRIASDQISLLIGSRSTRIRSDINFISDIARVSHRSFSLRTRIKVELCWHYRIRDIQTLKALLKYLCSKKFYSCIYLFSMEFYDFPNHY